MAGVHQQAGQPIYLDDGKTLHDKMSKMLLFLSISARLGIDGIGCYLSRTLQ